MDPPLVPVEVRVPDSPDSAGSQEEEEEVAKPSHSRLDLEGSVEGVAAGSHRQIQTKYLSEC